MGIFKEVPPTAGMPIHLGDIALALKNKAAPPPLEECLKAYIGATHARLTNSGTAALYLILETLKTVSAKRKVIIPAYICALVPLAIAKAGLETVVCDTTGYDFNFDETSLERICERDKDILAVMPAHIGGIPSDTDRLMSIAARYGIFVIEDCAQALGARHKGRSVGAGGDFSFFSLACGKGLTTYEGGLAVVNRTDLSARFDVVMARAVKDNPLAEAVKILELLGYWVFYRPELFWFVFRLPELFWTLAGDKVRANRDYFTADIPVHNISVFRQAIGRSGFARLEAAIEDRSERARRIIRAFDGLECARCVGPKDGDAASYPFVTVLFADKSGRDKAIAKRMSGASLIFLKPITDLGYLGKIVPSAPADNARDFASRHMTLSTSEFAPDIDPADALKNLRLIV
jgi:dTDP-4-amino-4,6-dideoxygalactose transaminase